MTWARLDDQFCFNPKISKAGNEVAGLLARAICWSSANSTEGFIPMHVASLLGASRVRARCTSAELWLEVDEGETFVITGRKDTGRRKLDDVTVVIKEPGYYIRDFLHYNRSRTDARANESADERADVQHLSAHKDARAARPGPSLPINQPTSTGSPKPKAGLVGSESGFGNLNPYHVVPEEAA